LQNDPVRQATLQFLLLVIAIPLVVWAADRCFCRGEFTALLRDAVNEERNRRAKTARRTRPSS
jgi:hypothetical protein